ncbi:hypothetical protein J7J23_01960 [bacterium]|nr:hypothetical protein [bacterium]
MKRAVIIFLLILFIGVGVAGFWYWNKNQYSKEILKLEILGPEAVQTGDNIEYLVRFQNNGDVRLENLNLSFVFPENSIPENGQSQRVVKKIDSDLYPGQVKTFYFRARIFGAEGDILQAKAYLTYRPKNLQATYKSDTSIATKIKFVPLPFEFDMPLKVENGQEMSFSLNYFSNSIDYTIEGLRVRMDYPEGFHFIESSPKALDQKEWDIKPLSKGDGGRIEIKGDLNGSEGDQKIFRAELGIVINGRFVLLKNAVQSVEIGQPSLYISQMVNSSQNYIASPGDFLHYEIFFKNISQKPIQKKFLFVKMDGDFFDISTLKSENGQIGRGDNTIVWDWKEVPSLKFLDVGQEGEVEFWVKLKDEIENKIKNPVLRDEISLGRLQRVFEIKVNSSVELCQKVYFNDEVFGNSGPIPPKVGNQTTYTVLWQVKNSYNDLANVKVKGRLPDNVVPSGKLFPKDAKFTYDSGSKEIIWNIGDMPAFQTTSTPLTLAFQIKFIPAESQKGTTPDLVEPAKIIAEDKWTSDVIEGDADAVNTTLPDDKSMTRDKGKVSG